MIATPRVGEFPNDSPGRKANPSLQLSSLAKAEADPNTPKPGSARRRSKREERQALKVIKGEEDCCFSLDATSLMNLCITQALMIVYVVSDAGRTLILQKALSTTVTNSTVMGLVCYVVGMVIATLLTAYYDGLEGLRRAWSPRKILHCLPAAFLFALATTLGNLGFAMGISPALYLVLGKFYTPVAAFCARWIMGKYYMPLEWLSLIILTLSSAAFGYLQVYNIGSKGPTPAPISAMAMVLGSAAVSALASLVTEKILKGERDAFHVQKVRLDCGSILSSLILIPVIGLIATRPQDVPWAVRPESYETCPADSVCWDLGAGTCSNSDCNCPCTSGIFAGWDTWLIFMAVFVNTTQGWLVGKVTHAFSVVHRAIADSFSLLAIYFLGDPLLNGKSLDNSTLNLVAMIVPLSTATFTVATAEMRKAFEAQKKIWAGFGPIYNWQVARTFSKAIMTDAQQTSSSWKCSYCKCLVKAHVEYCPKCWYRWDQVYDPSFVQGVPQNPSQQKKPKSPRRRSGNTPRRRNQNNQEHGSFSFPSLPSFQPGNQQTQTTTTSTSPSPFANTSYSGSQQQPTGTPWATQDLATVAAEKEEMIASIKRSYPDPTTMPPEIKAQVDKHEATSGRRISADLHKETTKSDRARKAIADLQRSKDGHRRAWIQHLEEAADAWKTQMLAYQQQQKEYSQLIEKAQKDLATAGAAIEALNARAVATAIAVKTPTSAPDPSLSADSQSHLDKQEAIQRQKIQEILSECAACIKVEDEGLVDLLSEDEMEETRERKRARSTDPPPAESGNAFSGSFK
eukprot:s1331_g31.t2